MENSRLSINETPSEFKKGEELADKWNKLSDNDKLFRMLGFKKTESEYQEATLLAREREKELNSKIEQNNRIVAMYRSSWNVLCAFLTIAEVIYICFINKSFLKDIQTFFRTVLNILIDIPEIAFLKKISEINSTTRILVFSVPILMIVGVILFIVFAIYKVKNRWFALSMMKKHTFTTSLIAGTILSLAICIWVAQSSEIVNAFLLFLICIMVTTVILLKINM